MDYFGLFADFIDSLDTTDFMKGYISGLVFPVLRNDSLISGLSVVDIPDFMKEKGDN